jgi:hypothetical protein
MISSSGYYTVGNKTVISRSEAELLSKQSKVRPSWHFHDSEFDAFDWTKEPIEGIETLYQDRCRQLRDEYDYLVLHYTGGSDSHNILVSFIQAGIHIDEIYCKVPLEYWEKYKPETDSKSAYDLQNEWYKTTLPQLRWVEKNLPKTKIRIHDVSRVSKIHVPDDWLSYVGGSINPQSMSKFETLALPDHVKISNVKKLGHIFGVDKPVIVSSNNYMYVTFVDLLANFHISTIPDTHEDYKHLNIERFYWHPNSAKIIIKQAHMLKKFVEVNPIYKQMITDRSKPVTWEKRTLYEQFIRGVIYPNWNLNTFQNDKQTSALQNEGDVFVFQSEFGDVWKSDIQNLIDSVGEDPLRDVNGFTGIRTKYRFIGIIK